MKIFSHPFFYNRKQLSILSLIIGTFFASVLKLETMILTVFSNRKDTSWCGFITNNVTIYKCVVFKNILCLLHNIKFTYIGRNYKLSFLQIHNTKNLVHKFNQSKHILHIWTHHTLSDKKLGSRYKKGLNKILFFSFSFLIINQ